MQQQCFAIVLKYDALIVIPKINGHNMFLAVKFVFLITASSNRRQSKDLKDPSLKMGRNLNHINDIFHININLTSFESLFPLDFKYAIQFLVNVFILEIITKD